MPTDFGLSTPAPPSAAENKGEGPLTAPRGRRSKDRRSAVDAALDYIARRDRTVSEVREHLLGKGHEAQDVEAAVARLAGLGYLDDRSYVEGYARRALSSAPMGGLRLRKELQHRGVERNTIEAGLAASFGPEAEAFALRAAYEKKVRGLEGKPDERQRRRIMSHLSRRGFRAGQILALLEAVSGSPGRDREEERN